MHQVAAFDGRDDEEGRTASAAASEASTHAVSIAGLELRKLRRRAGLSQQEASLRAGISDRTIRGLESGAIKTPQRATLDRLIESLGLAGSERTGFLAAWSDQAHRTDLALMVPLGQPTTADYLDRIKRQQACTRAVTRFERTVISKQREQRAEMIRHTVAITHEALLDWVYVESFDPASEEGYPKIVYTENCSAVAARNLAPGVRFFEFDLRRAVVAGETYSVGFDIAHSVGTDRPLTGPATESLTVFSSYGGPCVSEVQFHPDALPEEVWYVKHDHVEGPATRVHRVRVSAFHIAQIALEHPSTGVHGLSWTWPKD